MCSSQKESGSLSLRMCSLLLQIQVGREKLGVHSITARSGAFCLLTLLFFKPLGMTIRSKNGEVNRFSPNI